MFEKILVCLDGSSLAEQILPYVTEEAIRFRSKVVLLHVITTQITIPHSDIGYEFSPTRATKPGHRGTSKATEPTSTEVQLQAVKKEDTEATVYLTNVAQSLRKRGLHVETVTIQGQTGEAIVNYADRSDTGLIALATHGRGGLGRAVFGSVADYVIRQSCLPLLLIKPCEN